MRQPVAVVKPRHPVLVQPLLILLVEVAGLAGHQPLHRHGVGCALQGLHIGHAVAVQAVQQMAQRVQVRGGGGGLQVELARLQYLSTRLVRRWTHLERQRGASGTVGGPGETQKELDRRMIEDKIIRLERDLEKVKNTRELHRK